MKIFKYICLIGLLLGLSACSSEKEDDTYRPESRAARFEREVMVMADGWTTELPYETPTPGSYTLPKITAAGGGTVLDIKGEGRELRDLFKDKIVLLTFFYTSCTDLNGCPLATAVFYKIKERFKDDPKLANAIRIISVSFDPEHDTPDVMRLYGAGFDEGDPQWLFLTTESEETLKPITDQYGQMVIKEYDEEGSYTGSMAHVLRAFLIDRSQNIRQEYSVSFLHDQLVTADIKTLLIEDGFLDADEVQ